MSGIEQVSLVLNSPRCPDDGLACEFRFSVRIGGEFDGFTPNPSQ